MTQHSVYDFKNKWKEPEIENNKVNTAKSINIYLLSFPKRNKII